MKLIILLAIMAVLETLLIKAILTQKKFEMKTLDLNNQETEKPRRP